MFYAFTLLEYKEQTLPVYPMVWDGDIDYTLKSSNLSGNIGEALWKANHRLLVGIN